MTTVPTAPSAPFVRPDTRAWKAQVWISFLAAAGLCGTGLAVLPGGDMDRAFMLMGYVFTVSAAFALAKFIRDNAARKTDTPLFGLVVWGGFALAVLLTGWGLVQMQISPTYRAFLGVAWLFLLSSTFTLAKTLRDAHEAALADPRHAARAERAERADRAERAERADRADRADHVERA